MKTKYTAILAMLAGAAVTSAAVQALHAQSKPPVYFISEKQVTDPVGYKTKYGPLARASIKAHGGRILAAGQVTPIAGDPPKGRIVILAWGSVEQAREWFNSPDYKKAKAIGDKYSKSRYYFAIPGVGR
jgi:uncharacterized protein (DUF1330 family)